ncbi:hypothetical protein WA026_020916, partial [Henosepilachna vigintioctopunctata]
AQNFMIRNLKKNDELKQILFPRMRADMISMTAKSDPLVCAFGARYLKIPRDLHFVHVVSRKMRETAEIILEIKNINPRLNTILKEINIDMNECLNNDEIPEVNEESLFDIEISTFTK